jgi:multiple sugar transport system substrate-binding protein
MFMGACRRAEAPGQKTIRFTVWGSPASNELYQEVVNEFEERYPKIKVELMNLPWSHYHRKILTMAAAGSKLDVMRLANSYFPRFVAKGALLPLDALVQRDREAIDLDDFYIEALLGCEADGHIYGLPVDIAGWAVYYNRRLFDEAGLPYPSKSWTWKTFMDMARKLTRDRNGDGIIDQYGAYIKVKMGVIELLSGQTGAMVLNQDNSRCLFDSSEGRAVIQLLYDMMVTYGVVPPPEVRANQDLFAVEKVAMVLLTRGEVTDFRQSLAFDWDVASVPGWPGREPSALMVGGFNPWVIAQGTKLPEESWQFLRFFTSKEAVEIMAKTGRIVPARPAFLETSPPENNAVFLDLIRTPKKVFVPRFERYSRLEKIFRDNFQYLVEGRLTVESCTTEIARDVNQLIEEVRAEKK